MPPTLKEKENIFLATLKNIHKKNNLLDQMWNIDVFKNVMT